MLGPLEQELLTVVVCLMLGIKPGSLVEQKMLLTAEPSSQSLECFFKIVRVSWTKQWACE